MAEWNNPVLEKKLNELKALLQSTDESLILEEEGPQQQHHHQHHHPIDHREIESRLNFLKKIVSSEMFLTAGGSMKDRLINMADSLKELDDAYQKHMASSCSCTSSCFEEEEGQLHTGAVDLSARDDLEDYDGRENYQGDKMELQVERGGESLHGSQLSNVHSNIKKKAEETTAVLMEESDYLSQYDINIKKVEYTDAMHRCDILESEEETTEATEDVENEGNATEAKEETSVLTDYKNVEEELLKGNGKGRTQEEAQIMLHGFSVLLVSPKEKVIHRQTRRHSKCGFWAPTILIALAAIAMATKLLCVSDEEVVYFVPT